MHLKELLLIASMMVFCAQGVAQDDWPLPDESTADEDETTESDDGYLYTPEEWAALTGSDSPETDDEAFADEEESAMPGYVEPLDTSTSIESVREQGESYFDSEGILFIDAEGFESIENGWFPIPEVPEPTLVEDPEEE